MASGRYVKVYQSIVEDPQFERVFRDDRALAAWLRMLLMADALYPVTAPMPKPSKAVQLLVDCGLVIEKPGDRYTIRGLAAERERQSAYGRNAAAVRWHSGRNADPMPTNRTEPNPSESSARAQRTHDGRHADCIVCAAQRKPA